MSSVCPSFSEIKKTPFPPSGGESACTSAAYIHEHQLRSACANTHLRVPCIDTHSLTPTHVGVELIEELLANEEAGTTHIMPKAKTQLVLAAI